MTIDSGIARSYNPGMPPLQKADRCGTIHLVLENSMDIMDLVYNRFDSMRSDDRRAAIDDLITDITIYRDTIDEQEEADAEYEAQQEAGEDV
jgi:hypothetical protein